MTAAVAVRAAQNGAAGEALAITIVSPEPDTYAAGTIQLKAAVEPGQRVKDIARVMFYVDGRLDLHHHGTDSPRVPWDAGPESRST